jgi:hypothetical protein
MALAKTPDQLNKLQSYLEGVRTPIEETQQEVVDLFQPYRGDIYTRNSPGLRRKPLFDSFGVAVAQRFVNFLSGSLFPSSSDWVGLRAFQMAHQVHEIEVALDDSAKRIMDALAASNFYPASNTFVSDWGVPGNTTFMVQHDDEAADGPSEFGGLIFDPIAWSRVWWTFSHIGRPLVISREVEMPAFDAWHFFQKEGDYLPERLRELYRDQCYVPVKILHMVQRDPTGRAGTSNKPWKSHWLWRGELGDPAIMRKGGFDLQPYVVARMMVFDGDQYGRGIGNIARPQMKGANEISRQKYIALGKELNPPFLSEEGSLINFDATPSGHIVVEPPKQMAPTYLRSGTDFALVEQVLENMHKVVSDAFLGDALGEPETQDRSARATLSRESRALVRLSGTSQTMDHELLGPTIENVIGIMLKKNALPELEAVMRDNPRMQIQPVFSSPFFTAMKARSKERVDILMEQFLQIYERGGEFGPRFLDAIDTEELIKTLQELSDVPARIFRSPEEVEQIGQARDAVAAIQQLSALANRETNVQVRAGESQGSRPRSAGTLVNAATGINAA